MGTQKYLFTIYIWTRFQLENQRRVHLAPAECAAVLRRCTV